jgi:hypothetical protein
MKSGGSLVLSWPGHSGIHPRTNFFQLEDTNAGEDIESVAELLDTESIAKL